MIILNPDQQPYEMRETLARLARLVEAAEHTPLIEGVFCPPLPAIKADFILGDFAICDLRKLAERELQIKPLCAANDPTPRSAEVDPDVPGTLDPL